jgi:oxygen-independent coproporphyrinogen-3 oxidase
MAGIYLHIPFCKQACFYCDFHFSTSLKKKDELISCLIKELEIRKDELQTETIETIYFGGGTPSLLSIKEVELLLNAIYKNYNVIENPEITLEANPDDLPEAKILELAKSSVNRLSIGIQSFFEDDLKLMNRAHNANEAKKCLTVATHHFDNITVDLIYGIQNMSIDKWKVNLQTVFDFGINHISSYALTVEPNTALDSFIKNGKYLPLNEELAKQHFNVLIDETEKQGFVHYEISNFGKPNYFSKHNTSYWKGKKYIGIGPSAHSFNETQRSWNVSSNAKYIKSISENKLPNELEKLSKEDVFNEYIMTGLRTIWGVSLEKIKNDFGETYIEYLENQTKKHIDKELLYIENQILKTTKKGKFLADGIASDLFILN